MASSYKLEQLTDSAQPAVDVCDLKLQVSLTTSAFDDLLESFELAARSYIETRTGRILAPCSFVVYMDEFPSSTFNFSNGPVNSITSIEYLVDGVWTAVSADVYLLGRGKVSSQGVVLVDGQSWPTDKDSQCESVRITYVAGEANHKANQAIKLLVAHWFANREAVTTGTIATETPLGIAAMIQSLKVFNIP